ncbi:hypothetical protein BSKO_05517 [Bryopsis sp. KO-2023]|nr:hypothetical protein BSKO_05517 [Bryopsis sp. KO-2023]
MQNLARLEDDLYLSAFCQALRATCSEVRTIIMMSCVCEEEDFNALCNGLELGHPEGNASACVLQQANKAEEILTQQSKKKTPQSQGGGLGSLPPLVARALLSRIRMRKALHMGLERAVKKTKQDLAQACKHFAAGLSGMEMIRSTAKLGAEIVPGFEKGLYQAPAPGGPVRVSQALTLDETWDRFENLLGELQMACSLTTVGGYKELKTFLLAVVKKCTTPLARSVLHIQLDARKGISLSEPPRWCPSRRMIADAVNLPHKNGEVSVEVDVFLEQTLIGVQNWCQCMCLNRSRQRRRLKKGLEDWKNLLDHAYAADNSPRLVNHVKERGWRWPPLIQQGNVTHVQGPLMSWIELECCQSMILHLLMGYCEYLFARVLGATRELFNARPGAIVLPQEGPLGDKAKKSSKKKTKEKEHELVRTQKHAAELALLEVERQMCQGLIRLLLGVDMSPFNTEAERFYQRFSTFMELETPEPLDYRAFVSNTNPNGTSAAKVLEGAVKSFTSSRDHAQLIIQRSSVSGMSETKLAEVEALEKVAKINKVTSGVLMSLIAASGEETDMKAKFSFEINSFYPVVSITRG